LHHVMFDIDGTLVRSYDLDSICYIDAVREVTGICVDPRLVHVSSCDGRWDTRGNH